MGWSRQAKMELMSSTDKVLTISFWFALQGLPCFHQPHNYHVNCETGTVRWVLFKLFVYLPANSGSLENCFTQIPAEFRIEQEPNVNFFPTFCCTLCGKWKPAPRFVQLFRNPHSHLWLQIPLLQRGTVSDQYWKHQFKKATTCSFSTQNPKPHSHKAFTGWTLTNQYLSELCRAGDEEH